MSGRGLDQIPLRIPPKWDPVWFEAFVRDVLALADARNAIEGVGVAISGDPTVPATIAASADVEALVQASLVTVLSSDLENGRVLAGESEVIEIDDDGPGDTVTIRIIAVPFGKLLPIPANTVIGNAGADEDNPAATQLTADMAPDGLWANTKLADMAEATLKGRAAGGGTGVPEDLDRAAVLAILLLEFSDIGGAIDDSQVPESAVTQHEAALEVQFSQLAGTPEVPGGLGDYVDDAAAASGSVPVNGLYRTGSTVKIRVS